VPQDTHETAPTQFAETGGIRFAYRRFGRRGGTPLLLLNYFAANLDKWGTQGDERLRGRTRRDPLRLSRHRRLLRRDAIGRRGPDQGLC
jgi:hypothetical protein